MHTAPDFMCALVSSSSAAKWKYVKMTWSFFMCAHSDLIGSFTLQIISALFHTAAAVGTIFAPTFAYTSSANPEPTPAPCSTSTVWPWLASISAPAGITAARVSFVFISLGKPMIIAFSGRSGGPHAHDHLALWHAGISRGRRRLLEA